MSIELPEAKILAEQMNRELSGKRIKAYRLRDYERLQKIGFINKDIKSFDQLVDGEVESVISRGNAIRVKLNNGVNLLLSPEYGGEVFYHKGEATVPEKFHLRVDFTDGTALTVRLTSMGGVYVLKTDAAGIMTWNKSYGGEGYDWAYSLVQTSDEGYILAGTRTSLGYHPFLIKVDPQLQLGLCRSSSTDDSIWLYRSVTDPYWNFVRVRVWKIKEAP